MRFLLVSATCLAVLAGCAGDARRLDDESNDPRDGHALQTDASSAAIGDAAIGDAASSADDGGVYSPFLDLVAAQVYHDFPSLAGFEQAFKLEALLDPRIAPEQVASLRVLGPNGFVFDFANVPFSDLFNGYVRNDRVQALWYQAIAPGVLEDGRYTFELALSDGRRAQYSRDLVSNFELLDFYLAHKDELHYSPSSGTSPADDTVLRWSTLHDLGGPDAYYNAWISPGTEEFVAADAIRGDTIFEDAVSDPAAGLNAGSSRQGSEQEPLSLGPQTWQPEIVDANVLEDVNMIIFPPGQHFDAE